VAAVPSRAAGVVTVEGLSAFRRDLSRIDRDLAREVPAALKDAAEIVAAEARRRAPVGSRPIPRQRRPRRRMRDTIKPFSKGTTAGVRVGVVSTSGGKVYPYPRVLEFGRNRARAFLAPALAAKGPEVQDRVSDVLDRVADTWERR